MKVTKALSIICILMAIFATIALGTDALPQEKSGMRQGPPPEAYTACAGKTAGAVSQFVNPRGETVSGTCELEGDKLVLRPYRNKGEKGGKSKNSTDK